MIKILGNSNVFYFHSLAHLGVGNPGIHQPHLVPHGDQEGRGVQLRVVRGEGVVGAEEEDAPLGLQVHGADGAVVAGGDEAVVVAGAEAQAVHGTGVGLKFIFVSSLKLEIIVIIYHEQMDPVIF